MHVCLFFIIPNTRHAERPTREGDTRTTRERSSALRSKGSGREREEDGGRNETERERERQESGGQWARPTPRGRSALARGEEARCVSERVNKACTVELPWACYTLCKSAALLNAHKLVHRALALRMDVCWERFGWG